MKNATARVLPRIVDALPQRTDDWEMAIPLAADAPDALASEFDRVRSTTRALAAPLAEQDQCRQPTPDASPTKWHLAHTTWFYEAFVLPLVDASYRPHDERFAFLFNSYYEAIGPRQPRNARGM